MSTGYRCISPLNKSCPWLHSLEEVLPERKYIVRRTGRRPKPSETARNFHRRKQDYSGIPLLHKDLSCRHHPHNQMYRTHLLSPDRTRNWKDYSPQNCRFLLWRTAHLNHRAEQSRRKDHLHMTPLHRPSPWLHNPGVGRRGPSDIHLYWDCTQSRFPSTRYHLRKMEDSRGKPHLRTNPPLGKLVGDQMRRHSC